MSNQATQPNLSLADMTPEQVQAFLATLPADVLKQAANDKEQSAAQLIAEKERAYSELEAQIIPKLAKDYFDWVDQGKALKAKFFSELKTLMDLKFELVEFKDKKVFESLKSQKSITFNVEPFSLRVGRRSKDAFDHDAKVGLAKVEEYINSTNIDPKVSSLLISLIEKDKLGNLTPSSILALRNNLFSESNPNGIKDDSFKEGVRLLEKSWKKQATCFYTEVGRKDSVGKIVYEPGSFSAYELPPEINFYYFGDATN